MPDWYAHLKEWQTAIGAAVGFTALMAGALFNFRLNRMRDEQLRSQEAASIAAALYGEVVLLRRQVALLARIVADKHITRGTSRHYREIDQEFVDAYGLPEPVLYPALAGKLGLLDANIIIALTAFHRDYQEARSSLPLLVENEARGFSYSVLTVLEPARDAVRNVEPTLREIENLASVRIPAAQPDLGMVEDVIEMETEMRREHSD